MLRLLRFARNDYLIGARHDNSFGPRNDYLIGARHDNFLSAACIDDFIVRDCFGPSGFAMTYLITLAMTIPSGLAMIIKKRSLEV